MKGISYALILLLSAVMPARAALDSHLHIDSIDKLYVTNAPLALRQLDTLRHHMEATGWQQCSRPHLEVITALAHLWLNNHLSAQRHAHEALNNDSVKGSRWRMLAYQVLCESFLKTDNFALMGKYATLLGHESHSPVMTVLANIYQTQALGQTRHYGQALAKADSTIAMANSIRANDRRMEYQKMLFYYDCVKAKIHIYRQANMWSEAWANSLEILARLDQEEPKGYDYIDQNGYKLERLSLYLSMANICLAMGEDGTQWFDKAMALYPEFTNTNEVTRDAANYMFLTKRYADYERMVVPSLMAPEDSVPTEAKLHMAWQWTSILAQQGRTGEIAEWAQRGMEWNKMHADNIRRHAGVDFMMAYENQLKDMAIETQRAELQAGRFKLATAMLVAACAIAALLYMRHKKRSLQILYAMAEENLRKERSTEQQMIRAAKQMQATHTDPQSERNDDNGRNDTDAMLLAKLHDFLTTNERFRNSELSMESMAQQLGVRQKRLNSMLQTLKGTTLVGYVRDMRMEYACQLLREEPRMKVESVALQSGYNTPRQFMRTFKEKYNLTPSEYRRECMRNKA